MTRVSGDQWYHMLWYFLLKGRVTESGRNGGLSSADSLLQARRQQRATRYYAHTTHSYTTGFETLATPRSF